MAQLVKNPPAMQETWVLSLGWEDPLEKEKATHSSILARKIPWTLYSPWGCKELDTTEQLSLHFTVGLRAVIPYKTAPSLDTTQIPRFPWTAGLLTNGLQIQGFPPIIYFSSVQFSRSFVSDSLQPHESQHARSPYPSPTPRVYSYSCPSSR